MSAYWLCLIPLVVGIGWLLMMNHFLPLTGKELPEDPDAPQPRTPPWPQAVYWLGTPCVIYHLPVLPVAWLISKSRWCRWAREIVFASGVLLYSGAIALLLKVLS